MLSPKVIAGIAAAAALFACGWFARGEKTRVVDRPITQIQTQVQKEVQTQVQTQTMDHVVNHTVTVVKVVHDKAGNTTTTTSSTADIATTKSKDQEKAREVESKSVETVTAPASDPDRYSIGVNWTPSLASPTYVPSGAEVGYRVTGPVWIQGGYDWKNHDATVGVRLEF